MLIRGSNREFEFSRKFTSFFFIDTREVCQRVIYGRNLNCSLVRYSLYDNFCDRNIDTPQVSLEVE